MSTRQQDKTFNVFSNRFVPRTTEYARSLQCTPDDDLNEDLMEGPVRTLQCLPDCPGHECKYKCGKVLHAQHFAQHKLECPNIPVRCTAARDCPWHGPRKDLEQHVQQCKYVLLLPAMNQIDQLNDRLTRMTREQAKVSTDHKLQRDMMQNQLTKQQAIITALTQKLNTMESTVNDLRITALTLQNKALQQQVNRYSTSRSRL